MPYPNHIVSHQLPPLLTCPSCLAPMRIYRIEAADGRDVIHLMCETCNMEAIKEMEHRAAPPDGRDQVA